jgi:hypothetical protein
MTFFMTASLDSAALSYRVTDRSSHSYRSNDDDHKPAE